MGKRKKDGRGQRGNGITEQAQQPEAAERMARPQPASQAGTTDVARKRRRRFGHN
ncbi:MAG TPA: hypothetical protein VE546_05360 [Streptomyces sp.]|uniref:hypothetical protein n=1 Tax=Streptomyces sp. TaxID=1931 RepID=UPI002D2A4B7D|nr:hypothetical protein [Streptomyces sp.]HZG02989.1 hypothetical protein [Streptomyces sp.]